MCARDLLWPGPPPLARLLTRARRHCGWWPQIRVEKFNVEINVRILAPLRMLITAMERAFLLDKDDAVQVGAFSSIAVCVMQVGLDRLRAAWNDHYVAARRGHRDSGGRPSMRAHSGDLTRDRAWRRRWVWTALPLGRRRACRPSQRCRTTPQRVTGCTASLRSSRRAVPVGACPPPFAFRAPPCAAPSLSVVRSCLPAVVQVLGNLETAWMEILHGQHTRFIAAYQTWLTF